MLAFAIVAKSILINVASHRATNEISPSPATFVVDLTLNTKHPHIYAGEKHFHAVARW